MTFEQRVDAETAIARIYHANLVGDPGPFDDVHSQEVVERRVRDTLLLSALLRDRWSTEIDERTLVAELSRIVRNTRFPDRLAEIEAALGHDRLLLLECLARPVLVARLSRNFFAWDPEIHAAARQSLASIRAEMVTGRLRPGNPHVARREVTLVAAEPRGFDPLEPGRERPGGRQIRVLPAPELERRRGALPPVGEIGPVVAEREAYAFFVVLGDGEAGLRLARYEVPKQDWETWWHDVRPGLDDRSVGPVRVDTEGDGLSSSPASFLEEAGMAPGCPPADSWWNGSLDDFPDGRRGHTAVWTGTEMIVWGGATGLAVTNTGGRYDPLTDTWSPVSLVNAPSPRNGHSAVWTGSEMIVFGGGAGAPVETGGRYNPVTDTWTETSTANVWRRGLHAAVWTGTEMIVWGGWDFGPLADGGRYDPANDTWVVIPPNGAPPGRYQPAAVWTGNEMIVWGGRTDYGGVESGGRYDPSTGSWTLLGVGGTVGRVTAVWTGTEMIVFGDLYDAGSRYDPVSNDWIGISTAGQPSPRVEHSAVWAGTEMIVWGGYGNQHPLGDGARYDPDTDTWAPTAPTPREAARYDHTAVWTGDRMIVWGGESETGARLQSGGRYSPVSDSWTPTALGGTPSARGGSSLVWTGNEMIVWGGTGTESQMPLASGGRYDPLVDAWTPTTNLGAPAPRGDHVAVWAGDRMVVWGGTGIAALDSGGRYSPVFDAWLPTATDGAPAARAHHTGIWTGTEMIVWGGDTDGAHLASGGRYDPVADVWMPTTLLNTPSARGAHTAVWTGERMIVWGGEDAVGLLGDGGVYSPADDGWTPVEPTGAPAPRRRHSATWDGRRMEVWGGELAGGVPDGTGGLYDPDPGSWAPMSIEGGPSARSRHSAVWTGVHLLVWGGQRYGNGAVGGALYEPVLDSWAPMTLEGAPDHRAGHGAVWTGAAMLVWGGDKGTGGRYDPGSYPDLDGDGFHACATDCDDADPTTHAGAVEICDRIDNDCDGIVPPAEIDADLDDMTACEGDCDDTDPARYLGAPEICDGIDDDCDGIVPPGEADADGDGQAVCDGDCADDDPARFLGNPEVCDDLDNDCDGQVDGMATTCGTGGCASIGFCAAGLDDCVPGVPSPEVCDGIDNDCDALLPSEEADPDGDSFAECMGDCAPLDPVTYPEAPEVNDGQDNQCPGEAGYGILDELSGTAVFLQDSEGTRYCWPAQGGATAYRVARGGSADGTNACSGATTASTCWDAPDVPGPGSVDFYLARAEAPVAGSWGEWAGGERQAFCAREQTCDDGVDDDGDGLVDCSDTDDCFRDDACPSIAFEFTDTFADDIPATALDAFFSQVPFLPEDAILFSITGTTWPSFAWCAERADFYQQAYLANRLLGGTVASEGWMIWTSDGSGVWSGPSATTHANRYGSHCFGAYSWCSEDGLQGRMLAVLPGNPESCEATDPSFGCGATDALQFRLVIGRDRLSACGF